MATTHWDREWYETLQGFRMRLVSLLDEVFEMMDRDESFKTFVMDGQFFLVTDYLEIRPEKETEVTVEIENDGISVNVPPKKIATLVLG